MAGIRRESRLSTGRTNRVGTERASRSQSSLGHAEDTRLSISAGKWGHGDAIDHLLSSSQRRRDSEGKASRGDSAQSPSSRREQGSGSPVPSAEDHARTRAKFLDPTMTPKAAARARLEQVRGSYSTELQEVQKRLMANEATPFDTLQKALIFDAPDMKTAGSPLSSRDRCCC